MAEVEETDDPTVSMPKLNFIRDVAADVDFFGSHERVADAIANVISSNSDLKVIGLLGRWGSGKSTVVKHVQKRLNKLDGGDGIKTHVFCYDAWLHQSDPPRRSFLETFVDFLDSERLTTRERWKLQLDILNRQVEDTETISTPVLTPSGIWLLLSLALVPLGMQLIGNPWYTAASNPAAEGFAKYAFYIGWALLAVPVIIAIGIANFGNHEKGALLSLFVNRQVHKQTNRVTRNPDPTTIEFQNIFRAIIAGLPTGKRLIFVIDNLDRLHEAEAVAMWNTIRSFFLGKEHLDRSTRSPALPTVLLPIDQDAVGRIYSKDHGEALGKRLARSFLDKTFDLSFYVTPPVLSDWNLYVASQLKHVFGESLDEAWAYQVGRLYEAHSRGGHEVTPRAINVIINDIATLWLQWRTEIPFITIAYYVIFREKVEEDIFVAVNKPIVHIGDLDPDWQRGLAALHFGAPREKAIQVLIEPRVRSAFDDWEGNEFRELAALPGFPETLQRVLDSARPAAPGFVAQGAYLLSELAPEPAPWVSAAWSTLRDLYASGQPYDTIEETDRDAVKAMLMNCPAPLLPGFIQDVSARLSQSMEPAFNADSESRKLYVAMVAALVDTAREHGLATKVFHLGRADTYLETVQHAADQSEVACALRFIGDDQQLVDSLATQMTAAGAAAADAKFRALLHKDLKVEWAGLIESSKKFLAEHPGSAAGTHTAVTVLGHFWKDSDNARKAVRELADNGVLNTRISESYHPARYPRMAKLTALAILDERPIELPGGNPWEVVIKTAPTLPEQVRAAINQFDDSGTTHHLVAVSRQSPQALPLCRAIFTRKVELRDVGPLFLSRVLDELPDYLNCIAPERHRTFIAKLPSYRSFWTTLAERKFDENTRRVLRSLATSDLVSSADQKEAQKALKLRLQSVSQAAWKAGVESDAEPMPTARALALVSKLAPNAGQNLFEALKSLLPALVTDNVPDWGVRWFEAAALLSPASRKAAHRYLRDRILAGVGTPGLTKLLGLASQQFFLDSDFASFGDSTARHVIAPMLTSNTGRSWLTKNAALVKSWMIKAPEDARAFLKEQIRHPPAETDSATRKQLKAIASDWGL